MNGDDAAGVIAVRRLSASAACGSERILLLEAGLAPENFTGPLRRFHPDLILLLDAAEMGAKPGSIQVLDWRDSAGFGPSTHLQPPSTLAEFLMAELGCEVALIGIQPASLDFDLRLTPPVRRAVTRLVHALRAELCPYS
jgi:hydrogenase 3 maturation protease